ncbi:MAG TPA: FtsX-like permease family protein, partial [Gemmataceae bacterium]|nr:FtsX-like permease family protein [Gemmataceae bacterium]
MTRGRLLVRNLFYHWRGNGAVLLGVAVGTAVLTGALLVGDSLRGSLRDLALEQLGWVEYSLVGGRFIRKELASQLGAQEIAPVILLQGAASATSGEATSSQVVRRAGHVNILGVDDRFWLDGSPEHYWEKQGAAKTSEWTPLAPPGGDPLPGDPGMWKSDKNEIILNQALAGDLGVTTGTTITLHVPKPSSVPRETLLGRRDTSEVLEEISLTVRGIIANEGPGRFNLNPNPATPRNAFVPLLTLQKRLHQDKHVNALLAGRESASLQQKLQEHMALDDWGLKLQSPETRTQELFDKLDRNHDGKLERSEWRRRIAETLAEAADKNHDGTLERDEILSYYREHHPSVSLESRQMLLEPVVADAALAAAREAGFLSAPTLVYLANKISDGKQFIPYSIVAALDPALPAPLGPFLPGGVTKVKDDEIVLADWKESPLQVQPGGSITLTYFRPEIEGRIEEASQVFRLSGMLPLQRTANDADLTPEFPGITDKLDIKDWNPPFPYDNKLIQPRDEHYWEQYRTTPKAYVTLATGQRLWGSRFGRLTSIRFAPAANSAGQSAPDLTAVANDLSRRLLQQLKPEQGGFVFENVRARALASSSGSTDFGGLFLGFSFFLIAAALLLVGLLFRLNLDRRANEMGLLMATGFSRRAVRRLLLGEGAILAAVGGVLGLVGALGYAWLMLKLLAHLWPGGVTQSFLHLHALENHGLSYVIGYAAALAVSLLTIFWAVRVLGKVSARALLAGETAPSSAAAGGGSPHWSFWLGAISFLAAVACVVMGGKLRDPEMQASTFFGSGAFLLIAGLAAAWAWMRSTRHGRVRGQGPMAVARLGVRNAARHPVRSLLTAGLLAAATFLIVAVESFYRDPGKDFLDLHGGSGGFALLAESAVPIFQDLNSERGQDELNIPDKVRSLLADVKIYSFRVHAGDDVSCLNLYQPRRPRLLGVPQRLVERDGFEFKDSEARTTEERSNPWLLLEKPRDDGAIPVIGEANTVEWILHSGLGKELALQDERGAEVRLHIAGLLQNSVFQSELLLADANFLKLYPREEGHSFFLVQTSPERAVEVRSALETALADHGLTVTPAAQRLEAYLAVENTYLSTFQALGGLGLVLGALGLAVVLLRSIWERRGELALLRALGFRNSALGWLVLAENSFLLILGLVLGSLAALVSVAPHVLAGGGEVPWMQL